MTKCHSVPQIGEGSALPDGGGNGTLHVSFKEKYAQITINKINILKKMPASHDAGKNTLKQIKLIINPITYGER